MLDARGVLSRTDAHPRGWLITRSGRRPGSPPPEGRTTVAGQHRTHTGFAARMQTTVTLGRPAHNVNQADCPGTGIGHRDPHAVHVRRRRLLVTKGDLRCRTAGWPRAPTTVERRCRHAMSRLPIRKRRQERQPRRALQVVCGFCPTLSVHRAVLTAGSTLGNVVAWHGIGGVNRRAPVTRTIERSGSGNLERWPLDDDGSRR